MLAPLIGSVFSRPADQDWIGVPLFGMELFVEFPYFLVCIVVSILDIACLIVIIFFMPETLPSKVHKKKIQEIEMEELIAETNEEDEESTIGSESKSEAGADEEPLLEELSSENQNSQQKPHGRFALISRGVIISVILYIMISFLCPLITQVIPVWAAREPAEHGLDFEEQQLGIMYSIGSITSLLFQFLLFPRIDKAVGSANSFRGSIGKELHRKFGRLTNVYERPLYACCFLHTFYCVLW